MLCLAEDFQDLKDRLARKDIELLNDLGYDKLHVIIAKTPNSLSDDPKALGRVRGGGLPKLKTTPSM